MYIIYDDNNYKNKSIFVTYILIAINVFVYLGLQVDSSNLMESVENNFFNGYCMLPAEILSGKDVIIHGYFEASPHPVYLTIITSMFMHGGFWHLAGNMFFLFVFGDNLESALGPIKFLIFYLLCGVLASLLDISFVVLFDLNTYTRNIGASGAISGIIGGYMMLFPRNKIHLMFNIIFGFLDTPAFLWGMIWMAIQVIGLISIIYDQSSGVAYAAHIGGAIGGFFLVRLFYLRKKKTKPQKRLKQSKYKKMSKEGTKYISSNKIGVAISIPKSIWLIFLSMINGIIFGTVILYFDLSGFWLLLIKLLFALACVQITGYIVKAMKNRNRRLTYLVALLVSLISWYSMWAMNLCDFEETDYLTALSSPLHMLILFCKVQQYEGAFFLPDTLAFFLSIIMIYEDPEYVIGLFCENCKSYYNSKKFFFLDAASFLNELEQSTPGKYYFITKYDTVINDDFFVTLVKEDAPYNYISLELFTCEKCINESLLTIQKVVKYYEIKDDEPRLFTDYEPTEIVNIYIDKETEDIIMEKYRLAQMKTGVKNLYTNNENEN